MAAEGESEAYGGHSDMGVSMSNERDCFSDQSFAVQLRLNGPTIRQVMIGGRPAGQFGLAAKSHLVPWLSMCDGLRADLVGQNLHAALERLLDMCAWAEDLPGQRLAEDLRRQPLPRSNAKNQKMPADLVPVAKGTPAWWHARATEHMGAVQVEAKDHLDMADSDNPDVARLVPLVQNLAAGYLHFRNTSPLTTVPVLRPTGAPKQAAALVRESEALLASELLKPEVRDPLTAALWELMDSRALDALLAKPAHLMDPRIFDGHRDLKAYVLTDHVRSMEHAYPRATYETSFVKTLPDRLSTKEMDKASECLSMSRAAPPSAETRENAGQDMDGILVDADGEDDTGDIFERFAVQFAMDTDGTSERLYVGARPASARGRHVTAWVVLCDYVRSLVDGASLAQVAGRIEAARVKLGEFAEAAGLSGIPAARKIDTSTQVVAQACVAEFLTDLNELDGAITDTGGTSGGAKEGDRRSRLRSGEATVLDVAGMLDPKCLAWKPPKSNYALHAYRVILHLHMIEGAYRTRVLHRTPEPDAPLVHLVGMDTLAALLVPAELDGPAMNRVNATVLAALAPDETYDDVAYGEAVERSRHDQRVRERESRKDKGADYRPSQDSDDGEDEDYGSGDSGDY